VGGLSEVKREAIYDVIRTRYFSRWREALPKLCALRQYEIRAHNFFVESQLPRQEVISLQEERLLTGTTERNYGMLYDLGLSLRRGTRDIQGPYLLSAWACEREVLVK